MEHADAEMALSELDSTPCRRQSERFDRRIGVGEHRGHEHVDPQGRKPQRNRRHLPERPTRRRGEVSEETTYLYA